MVERLFGEGKVGCFLFFFFRLFLLGVVHKFGRTCFAYIGSEHFSFTKKLRSERRLSIFFFFCCYFGESVTLKLLIPVALA